MLAAELLEEVEAGGGLGEGLGAAGEALAIAWGELFHLAQAARRMGMRWPVVGAMLWRRQSAR